MEKIKENEKAEESMNSSVRSDLAIESAEMFNKTEKLRGVRIYEEEGKTSGIHITRVIVENAEGAEKLGGSSTVTAL